MKSAKCLTAALALLAITAAKAQTYETNPNLISDWLAMVTATQAEQPHWMTPVATVTPELVQEVRADFSFARLPGSKGTLDNYGNSKGLEIIPTPNTEIIIGVPPYEVRQQENGKPTIAGWGDWPLFLVKYRILSQNEQSGDQMVTAFFQVSKPTYNTEFSESTWLLTPTLAAGKGWGSFDIQATISGQFPTGGNFADRKSYGDRMLTNVAFQYNVGYFWPEVELNDTWFAGGDKQGKNQLLVTPGVILGRFQIHGRIKASIGLGYQIAATPAVPSFRNNLVLTTRLTF